MVLVVDALESPDVKDRRRLFPHFLSSVSDRPKASPKVTYVQIGGYWSNTRGYGGLETWTDERQPRTDYVEADKNSAGTEDPILLSTLLFPLLTYPDLYYNSCFFTFGSVSCMC